MAFRSDVTVDFDANPRIVEIAAPATTINIQDLYDTLRTIEAQVDNLNRPNLVDNIRTAGKQTLSAVKQVGITLALNNALLKFADRAGPSHTNMEITDGNLVAIDDTTPTPLFIDPVDPSAFINTIRELDVSAALLRDPGFPRGIAIADWPITMLSAVDHITPLPGLTVSGFIKQDGSLYSPLVNAVTEADLGSYQVDITGAEVDFANISLRFTAPGADPVTISFFTNV